ncbi:hypothetical protein CPB85DRAFT_1455792 [Mucidula mucida]|nr:hypothetical protein CPB85DRAFT_1455792 [Mucidula mucida]
MSKKPESFGEHSRSGGTRLFESSTNARAVDNVDHGLVGQANPPNRQAAHWSNNLNTGENPTHPSVAQSLPYELVSRIFFFLEWYSPRRLASGVSGPWWAATQICRQWRRALCGEARLWTKLAVYMPSDHARCPAGVHALDMFSIALERSKELPLEIEVGCDTLTVQTKQALIKLFAVAPRVVSLRVELPMTFCVAFIMTRPSPVSFPKTKRLDIKGGLGEKYSFFKPASWQRIFPTVEHIHLEGIEGRLLSRIWGTKCSWKTIDVHVAASGVEDFMISRELQDAIAQSGDLQCIRFKSSWVTQRYHSLEVDPPSDRHVTSLWQQARQSLGASGNIATNHSVRKLVLDGWQTGILPAALWLPNLQDLEIDASSLRAEDRRATSIWAGVVSLLSHALLPLTTFKLTMSHFHKRAPWLVLRSGGMHQLQFLSLRFVNDPRVHLKRLFHDLRIKDSGDNSKRFKYLPCLRDLRLEVIPAGDSTPPAKISLEGIEATNKEFVRMLLNRWNTVGEGISPVLTSIVVEVVEGEGSLLHLDSQSIQVLEDRMASVPDVKFAIKVRATTP